MISHTYIVRIQGHNAGWSFQLYVWCLLECQFKLTGFQLTYLTPLLKPHPPSQGPEVDFGEHIYGIEHEELKII